MKTLSIVIPALNEEKGIARVIQSVPLADLKQLGYEVEILVVDNGSTDDTAKIARTHGVTVVSCPTRGYGNAYKAGFAFATGDVIATGDADLTYPFEILPYALIKLESEGIDFLNTDRLSNLDQKVMSKSHQFGNFVLTFMCRILFGWPFKDSQSGMWIFKRSILNKLIIESTGMPFSQELKIEAFVKGFKCDEIKIEYRNRAGKEKLDTVRDGYGNVFQLFAKKLKYIGL